MQIKVKDLTEKITNGDYDKQLVTKKYGELKKATLQTAASKLVATVVDAIQQDHLAQVQLHIDGQRPVTFALETNIINLPFANVNKLSHFFDDDDDAQVNVYFIIMSDYINVSHFRIDELTSTDEFIQEPAMWTQKLEDLITDKLKFIREVQVEKPSTETKAVTKKRPAKKATAKKTTEKKATKKTTARKSKKS